MAVGREAIAGDGPVDRMDNASALPILSTGAQADAANRGVIERNDERSGFQLRTEIMRSRGAGPLQNNLVWLRQLPIPAQSGVNPGLDRDARSALTQPSGEPEGYNLRTLIPVTSLLLILPSPLNINIPKPAQIAAIDPTA